MESGGGSTSDADADFIFASNYGNFADRVLRIEIIPDPVDTQPGSELCTTDPVDTQPDSELCTTDPVDTQPGSELCTTIADSVDMPDEQILNENQPGMDEFVASENQDEEFFATVEEFPYSDEAIEEFPSDDPNLGTEADVRVKTLHISSPILAAKSPFFYKLFSNGMRESELTHVTLKINASEEVALMELLNFMYGNELSVTTVPGLIDVLMAADKFEVVSCMRHCSQLLQNLAMTHESAVLYLQLPSNVLMDAAVQPLTDAAKQYLAGQYKDITKEEVMDFPLAGIEAILSCDDLQIASEDAVYDFVLKWARHKYNNLEERREVLGARLARLIRFPYMTSQKLRTVLTCSDFEHELSSKLVLEALFFKAEVPDHQLTLAAEEPTFSSRQLLERTYKYRPVKVVKFELPRQQCVVYLDLKREECSNLYPSGRVYSQAFQLGGHGFYLSAHCNMDQQNSFHCFGLFLGMQEKGSVSFTVDYEFATRLRTTEEFVTKYKSHYTFTGGKAVGNRNLFAIPWTSFMAEDCLYFINGVLHLKAELTIRNSNL